MRQTSMDNYVPVRGYECHNACMVNDVNTKIEISTSDIYFSVGDQAMSYDGEGDLNIHSNRQFVNKYGITSIRGSWEVSRNPMELFDQITEEVFVSIKICPEQLGYSDIFQTNRGAGHYINVLQVKEDQAYIADGYVSDLEGDGFAGWVDLESLLASWKSMDMRYKIVTDIDRERLKNVKRDAREYFLSYMKKHHEEVVSENTEEPHMDILRYFKDFLDKYINHEEVAEDYYETFLFNANVHGFMIVKSMIWEKVHELYTEDSETYRDIYNKWKHIMLCIRKYLYGRRYEKLGRVYEDVVELVKREDAFYQSLCEKPLNTN